MTDISMVEAAAKRLAGKSRLTPLLSSPFLDKIARRRLFVKAECLQHTGSFKFRGAWSAISALPKADRAKGVIAFSSGNHAQGVVVSEEECLHAMVLAYERLKIVLEPGGGVALAAALFHGDKIKSEDVIVVASGGNVDKPVFKQALERFGGTE